MAPLIKDTLEFASPAGESTQVPHEKTVPHPMRAGAVSLEVQVKVHGSKVTEVGRGLPPRTEPFEEQTSTMIVFPQGAVLRLAAQVNAGQMLVLTNLKTRQDAICRVLKVRANTNFQSYVEVEFTSPQATFWGVTFPSASNMGPSTPSRSPVAPAALPATPAQPFETPVVLPAAVEPMTPLPGQDRSRNALPLEFGKSPVPVSAFTAIGSQEKVQPAASEVSKTLPPTPLPRNATPSATISAPEPLLDEARLIAAIDSLKPPEAPLPVSSISLEELIGDSRPAPEPEQPAAAESSSGAESFAVRATETEDRTSSLAPNHADRPILGSFAATTGASSVPPSTGAFGARLGGSLADGSSTPRSSSRNFLLLAACAGFVFVAVAAGLFFFRSHAAMRAVSASPVTSQSSPNVLPSAPADSSVLDVSTSSPVPASSASLPAAQPIASLATKPVAAAPAAVPPEAAAAISANGSTARALPTPKPAITSAMVTETLNAHPVAPSHADDAATEAPSVDAASDDSGAALPGAIGSPSGISVPTPSLQPAGAVKVGGQVKEPRLISSPPPVYPQTAIHLNIQGDVVIRATIDTEGNVAEAHVVSGPAMLRGPALDALRRWKYQPSLLDGQPISVEMLVTIHFRHQ
jgi:periplasmic protein TonB